MPTTPAMQIGATLPTTELGSDAGGVRAYLQGVERLGYKHLLAFDHVVGADPAVHEGWNRNYTVKTEFHEPLVLFAFAAGITSLELVTNVLVLPQRQTILVAKQTAELDLLSEGRLRVGVGVGWNAVEYEALGKDFANRGARVDEQIALLRRLWTESTITVEGGFERITGAGIAPLPRQRPIPIWIGAGSPVGLRRAGRVGDGWFPMVYPGPKLDEAVAIVDKAARDAGRDPATIEMEGNVPWASVGSVPKAVELVEQWRSAGARYVGVNTMGAGLTSVDEHLRVLGEVAEALQLGAS